MKIYPGWAVLFLAAYTVAPAPAQPSFASGSTNLDGALTVAANTTLNFCNLSANGNNVYNYTTITINTLATVNLSGSCLNGPIYWLASGAVTINGTVNLNGAAGAPYAVGEDNRSPAYPGAGGYAGGVGGSTTGYPAQPGSGPGGGAAGTSGSGAKGGTFTGSTVYLVPLVGGSGGGGAYQNNAEVFGPGGGGGGGAILIASSVSITLSGYILANGGGMGTPDGVYAGGGSGGAVHLIAPTINGGGEISTLGGGGENGTNGQIRIEAQSYSNSFSLTTPYTAASTPNLFLPATTSPAITVVSVGGTNLPATPTGSFAIPDANINSSPTTPVPVVINASNIPTGTQLTLQFLSDNGADFSVQTIGLAGTLASSTVTVNVTFPAGFTRGYVIASW